jgi:hypothetical protein
VLRRVLLSLLTDSAVVAEVAMTRDETAVESGAAHGALAMTTPGDTTRATKAEVLKLAAGSGARVDRRAGHEMPILISASWPLGRRPRARQRPVGYG